MRICFLSALHPALDKRVFGKEAVTLARGGHDVIHLAPADEDREWVEENVRVVTYHKSRDGILPGRFRHLPRLYKRAAEIDADVYHCNEVDSWLVGILLKLRKRRRVVFDVHEHYPSDFTERRLTPLLQPPVAFAIKVLFAVLTVFTDRLVMAKKAIDSDFPAPRSRKVLVENFADLTYSTVQPRTPKESDGRVTALHIGEMGRVRGWPQLLDALTLIHDDRLRVELVGRFSDGSGDAFRARVAELALAPRLQIEEWMPFAEVYQRILAADIGLVLFQPGLLNHVLALPHKMFDYMMAGLPVIAPRFAVEVAEIVRDADCGILIDPSKPEEIASAIQMLIDNPAERRRLGENGRRGVLQKYNWDAEGRKLLRMYDELAAAS